MGHERDTKELLVRILVVGDLHCKPNLLTQAVEIYRKRKCDYLVFLGDACDNWGAQQSDNAEIVDALITFKQELKEHFVWLIGNHDWGYYASTDMTGHIHFHESIIYSRFLEHFDDWEVVAQLGRYVFSHAGISKAFAKAFGGQNVVENIALLKKQTDPYAPLNFVGQACGGYSSNPSPLWARPEEVDPWTDDGKVVQIVGHTPLTQIENLHGLVICDTLSQYSNKDFIGDRSLLLIEDDKLTAVSIDTNRKLYEVEL